MIDNSINSSRTRSRNRHNFSNDFLRSSKSTYYQSSTPPPHDSKEDIMRQWEQRLRLEQMEIDRQREELDLYQKQLDRESQRITKEKIELNEKYAKYCAVLEQIQEKNGNITIEERSINMPRSKPSIHNSPKSVSVFTGIGLQNQAIQSCQARIANLLNSIRKQSQSRAKPPQSKKSVPKPNKNEEEFQEYLFGQSNRSAINQNSFVAPPPQEEKIKKEKIIENQNMNHMVAHPQSYFSEQILPPKPNYIVKPLTMNSQENMKTTESEKEIHELKLKSIQMNEQLFYKKIQLEVDKLKALKKKML